jgi:uncharacterized phage protein (TIGR01671 family)
MRGFRVWSDFWKRYAFDAELYADGSLYAMFEDDDGVPHHENTDLVLEFDTGLKDKNGKDICGGDIIKANVEGAWGSGNVAYLGAMEWNLEAYWDEARCAFMWHVLGSKTQPDRVYDFYDDRVTEIEIIGNIHENAELLGDEE